MFIFKNKIFNIIITILNIFALAIIISRINVINFINVTNFQNQIMISELVTGITSIFLKDANTNVNINNLFI